MPNLVLTFTDGSHERISIDRLDRDEVDQFLDDLAAGLGAVLVTDSGPLCVTPNVRDLRYVRVITDGNAWLEGRIGGEEFDDD